jgi:hypothetical protein
MSDQYSLNTNPYAFLSGRGNVLMGEAKYDDATSISNWRQKNAEDKTVLYRGDVYWELGFANPKITLDAAKVRSPVVFMPYEEDACTYMKIQPNAAIFFTSQLSGCNVYVATITGNANAGVWVFHANANSSKGDDNNRVKRLMAEKARNQLGGSSWDLSLERGTHANYKVGDASGIFFGQTVVSVADKQSAWGFYLYKIDGSIIRLASSVAGTNATATFTAS